VCYRLGLGMTILRLERGAEFDLVNFVRSSGTKVVRNVNLHDILKRQESGKKLRRRQKQYLRRIHARG